MALLKSNFLIAFTLLLRTVIGQSTSYNYCELLGDVLSVCQLETPSFTALAPAAQASCVCGSTLGTIPWGGATFDSLAASCASQYATIDVTIASDANLLTDFCTGFGGAATTGMTTATATTARQTTATSAISTSSGLFTSPATTSRTSNTQPTTVISVVTASPASTSLPSSGGAAKAQELFGLLGWALPFGGLLFGGL